MLRERRRLAPAALAAAVAAIAIALAALSVRSGDLVTPTPAGAARPAAPPPTPAERYAAVRERGAPVALVNRALALRGQPRPDAPRIARVAKRTEWRSPRALAVVGRRGGWLRVIATELPNGRRGWVPMSAVQLVPNPWALRVDLSARRVTVLRHGHPVRQFSVAVGGTATPTPTGRFAVTDKLDLRGRSAAYGCCALALSAHQPHIAQGWTGGDRIAIHGTEQLWTVGTAASHGCMRARDADAHWIVKHVFLGTVVRIRS